MTTEVVIPKDDEFHLVLSGPGRIQIANNDGVLAHYSDTAPTPDAAVHLEKGNIAYPGEDNVYIKVLPSSLADKVALIVTEVEVIQ
ncbi:hypothetical protein M316_0107 [Nitrincola phage 1M3-16]|uniref:hypothetical protein n=1 Tax=Nitrincola phage 1M3-16 TaxID=1472912 RepID=UPI000444B323|nr:hypothetical protein GJ22_gp045 [Nitrincola phage 1M3-16]AHX01172.1 hypothetical protein M316_0107 [Nitrincola phage 1M3-16]